jgi:MFS superfamily sulfate permease-like transporter
MDRPRLDQAIGNLQLLPSLPGITSQGGPKRKPPLFYLPAGLIFWIITKPCPVKVGEKALRSLSKEISFLLSFLVEFVIYVGLMVGYFFLILHYFGGWVDKIYKINKIYYAFLALGLVVGQGLVLERLTAVMTWLIERFQVIIPVLVSLARPHETVTRPEDAPGLLIYRFGGPLLAFNANYFAQRVQELVDEADPPVTLFLVNAEAIIDMDRTGVETLDELHNTLKKKNIELGFCEVKGHFRKMLMSTPLHRRVGFNVYPSVAATIQHLTKKSPQAKK